VGLADQHHAGTAGAALDQAGEKVPRPAAFPIAVISLGAVGAGGTGKFLLSCLRPRPKVGRDDAQFGNLGHDLPVGAVGAGNAAAGVGIVGWLPSNLVRTAAGFLLG
jgi:hypothetical protein